MTIKQCLEVLLRAPWTVESAPAEQPGHIVVRIRELPPFLVVGEPNDELDAECWLALESLLESYLEDGQDPPLPAGYRPPWARTSGSFQHQVIAGEVSAAQSVGDASTGESVRLHGSGKELVGV